MKSNFKRLKQAIKDLQAGKLIVVLDDDQREAEGDLVGLAEFATPESVNFMVTHARGLICAPLSPAKAAALNLSPMVAHNTDGFGTNFTVSVDALTSTTGISAGERSQTLNTLANRQALNGDFMQPGHIFPLIAKAGGVLERPGHTEATIDLARLAQAEPVGYICEILNPDGTMSRRDELRQFATTHQLTLIEINELSQFIEAEGTSVVKLETTVALPTLHGDFLLEAYSSQVDDQLQLALIKQKSHSIGKDPLVRLHSECLTGDVFGSQRCDCGEQLDLALEKINEEGQGIVLYLRQEGRGIGLLNKLKTYALQEQGLDTYEANVALGFAPDARDYHLAAAILKAHGLTQIRLLTNNPEKIVALEAHGIVISERIPLESPEVHPSKRAYLATKKTKFNHLLTNI